MSGISGVNSAAAASVPGLDAPTVQLITTGLGLIHVLQVYTSSMVAIAAYDWLACLKAEWEYIWKKDWSLIKGLYLWTRYYGLICFSINLWLFNAEFTFEQCKSLHYLIAATCMWTTLGSEAILAVRTYAFLGKPRWLGILLGVMLIGETGFLLYVAIAAVYQIPPPPFPLENPRGPCTASDKPGSHIVSGFWLAPVAFDLICTFLTIWKAFTLQQSIVRSPIIKIFIREGLGYFLAVAGVNVLNAAFMFQKNPNLQNINCFLALVLSQVLCCRLVLNLKGAQEGTSKPGTNNSNTANSYTPAPRSGGVSIPLGKYRGADSFTQTDFTRTDIYDGVKVEINVEQNNDDSRQSSDMKHHASAV
ncbi:hypothetical protein EST38_g988 [Candolleomyces aberdarensis]|uniref:DUF6533 domain-containing protein n=1 Tax=Candolleomyces aberdarensis TaxID=2316362 RepID=A0A4Q2DYP8_9AGAR|nr:hypothetical protein EST38_g988 [Candolleomyces aberdarensis]